MKKEDLKTRPDLNDEQYLVYLTALPENRGIDVRGLYLDMHEWCAKKRERLKRKVEAMESGVDRYSSFGIGFTSLKDRVLELIDGELK